MSEKHLIAGPWAGEFGWELYAWQGYVRALSRNFDKTTIISRPNSNYLYKDFADEFIGYTPSGGASDSFFMHNFDTASAFKNIIKENNIDLTSNTTLFTPRRMGNPPYTHYTIPIKVGNYELVPEYHMYGEKTDNEYDYIFHIRDRELRRDDNWDIGNWIKLRKLLGEDKKIACIGTYKQSGYISGTDDHRDKPLKDVCDLIKSSKAVFGPSSGPMHLTSLCGVPHVVWSIKDHIRYTKNWNPFNTPILYLNEFGWRASPEYIHQRFLDWSFE